MHLLSPAQNGCLRMLTVAAGVLLFGAGNPSANGQPTPMVATAARIDIVRGNNRRMLDQLQRYLDAQQYDDAWSLVGRLIEAESPGVIEIEESLYVSLRSYCHRLLSRLPPDALAEYRQLVDPTARAWYRQGIAQRDRHALQRVVDELLCSIWGDDALLALGELALARGEYLAARTYWQSIHGGQLGYSYPDSQIDAANLQARLALVSIRSGEWERAAEEVAQLTASRPNARGRLAGRDVVYAQKLTKLLDQARQWPAAKPQSDWPTAGGSFARTHAVGSDTQRQLQPLWTHAFTASDETTPSVFPIAVGELVVYQDATGVHALHLATGKEAFHADSATFRSHCSTLSARDNQMFGTESDGTLWGLDLDRDGALFFRGQPSDSGAVFTGAPVVDGTRLLLETRTNDHSVRAGIACFDLATGELIWRRWLGRANLPRGRIGSNLLATSPGVVYASTNLGAIAAVRPDDGQILWLRTYSRALFVAAKEVSCHKWSPAVYQRGVLYALPADSRQLLALDAATGELLWSRSALASTAQLVGITETRIVLASDGLHLLEPSTGDILKSDFNRQLAGQGIVAGDVVLWPENQSIQRIDLATGEKLPGELSLPEPGGANLLAVGDYLLAAGPTQLTVFRFAESQDD